MSTTQRERIWNALARHDALCEVQQSLNDLHVNTRIRLTQNGNGFDDMSEDEINEMFYGQVY